MTTRTTTKRDFLRLDDLTPPEARRVLDLARRLKAEAPGRRVDLLRGRSIAIVLEKASTRTRVSFELSASHLGAHPVVLQTEGSQMARGEPMRDTARVLSRYCEAIVHRTFATSRLLEMATAATVPVVNALSDDGHPVQVLCDVFSMEEAMGAPVAGRRVAFVGDGSSNMARSFLEAARLFGFELALACPEGFRPPAAEVAAAGKHVRIVGEPRAALDGVCAVHTDVWTSMGQEAEAERRRHAFAGFTVTERLLAAAPADAKVYHCLPAHRGEEIDDATLEGPRSRVWDQAENRLHVQKALLCFLLGVADEVS
jgi:ornithine carbamoyltransferase